MRMRINKILNETFAVSHPKFRRVLTEKIGMSGDYDSDYLFRVTEGKVVFTSQKSLIVSSVTSKQLLNPDRPPNSFTPFYDIRISSRVLLPNHKIPKCLNTTSYSSKLRSYYRSDGLREVPSSDVTVETLWKDFVNDTGVLGYHLLAIDTILPAFESIIEYERGNFNINDAEEFAIDVLGARDIVLASYLAENDLGFPHPSTIF